MIAKTKSPRRSNARGAREDGLSTKASLLDAAGLVFAEHGFDRATAKEITLKAGTNGAAVNYHFGGIERLYQEVLMRAHDQLLSLQDLQEIMREDDSPERKLRQLCTLIASVIAGPKSQSWAVRVISREFFAPSQHFAVLREKRFEPKKTLVFRLIAELLKLPDDHPAVARCFLNFMAPCALLLLADRQLIRQALPALADLNASSLAAHLTEFALGGIDAIAQQSAL